MAETFGNLIDQKSSFTGRHSRTVSGIAVALAEELAWNPKEVRDIRLAGFLHDFGKLAVPKKILDKPGLLDHDELMIIKSHAYHTYKLLSSAAFPKNIVEWAAYHHERLDGRGYPFRLEAQYITTGSRLMTIADIYTALTEERPYRKPLSKEKALSILEKGVGISVDGKLLAIAKRVLL